MDRSQRAATIAMMDAILACSCASPEMICRASALKHKLEVEAWTHELFGDRVGSVFSRLRR